MAKRRPSPDELDLWHRATHDTVRLGHRRARSPAAPPSRSPAPPQPSTPRPAPVSKSAPPPPELSHGRSAGLDKRSAERLKRGRLAVEATVDLHGLTQAEAHDRLDAFLEESVRQGRRCVLVITGKGMWREGAGVLRQLVPRWLNERPNRARVLAFDHAQQRDGGAGALYVLLKRRR